MAQWSAMAFGALSICYGIRGVISPINFATDFGFPPALSNGDAKFTTQSNQRNPFVTATGGRTSALGLAIMILAMEGQVKAAGTVIFCCALSGLCDAMSCYMAGKRGAVLQHAIGTLVLGIYGSWLRSQ